MNTSTRGHRHTHTHRHTQTHIDTKHATIALAHAHTQYTTHTHTYIHRRTDLDAPGRIGRGLYGAGKSKSFLSDGSESPRQFSSEPSGISRGRSSGGASPNNGASGRAVPCVCMCVCTCMCVCDTYFAAWIGDLRRGGVDFRVRDRRQKRSELLLYFILLFVCVYCNNCAAPA